MPGPGEGQHEHRVALALRDALPTRRHGEMLFEMATERLGASARVESTPDGKHRVLYRLDGTDPHWVLPWPLLTLNKNPRQIIPLDIPGLKPAPPLPPRPGKAPNLRGLGPGFIQLQDGRYHVQVAYAEDGRWFEMSRNGPASALEGALPLLAAGGAPPAEVLAGFMTGLDIARCGPMRVFLPDPGAWNAWAAGWTGLALLRAALARGAVPADAQWIATDPVDGSALAWGATRDETLFAWSAEVERVRPGSKPPTAPERPSFEPPGEPDLPAPPDEEPGKGRGRSLNIRLEVGGADPLLPGQPAPPPPPPGVIPTVLVPLGTLPQAPPPFGSWRRFLGSCGVTVAAAFREDPVGWTLIGEKSLAALGAPDAESAMDEAERANVALRKSAGAPPLPVGPATAWMVRMFRLLDGETGSPIPPVNEQALLTAIRGLPPLDGDVLAIGSARMRRTTG